MHLSSVVAFAVVAISATSCVFAQSPMYVAQEPGVEVNYSPLISFQNPKLIGYRQAPQTDAPEDPQEDAYYPEQEEMDEPEGGADGYDTASAPELESAQFGRFGRRFGRGLGFRRGFGGYGGFGGFGGKKKIIIVKNKKFLHNTGPMRGSFAKYGGWQ